MKKQSVAAENSNDGTAAGAEEAAPSTHLVKALPDDFTGTASLFPTPPPRKKPTAASRKKDAAAAASGNGSAAAAAAAADGAAAASAGASSSGLPSIMEMIDSSSGELDELAQLAPRVGMFALALSFSDERLGAMLNLRGANGMSFIQHLYRVLCVRHAGMLTRHGGETRLIKSMEQYLDWTQQDDYGRTLLHTVCNPETYVFVRRWLYRTRRRWWGGAQANQETPNIYERKVRNIYLLARLSARILLRRSSRVGVAVPAAGRQEQSRLLHDARD